MSTATLPPRNEVNPADCWDLTSLCVDDDAWEADFKKLEEQIPVYESFRGRLAESAEVLHAALVFDSEFEQIAERLGTYAFLKTTEDQANSKYQALKARYQNLAVKASQAASFMRPEILAIDADSFAELLEDDRLELYRLQIGRAHV